MDVRLHQDKGNQQKDDTSEFIMDFDKRNENCCYQIGPTNQNQNIPRFREEKQKIDHAENEDGAGKRNPSSE